MPSRERIIWIVAICVAIIATFLITNKLALISPQAHLNETQPTKQLTDREQEAEAWFSGSTYQVSRQPPIPARRQYNQLENMDPLLIYQDAIKQNQPWINYPEQIALRAFFPPPEIEGFTPSSVNIYYYNANVVTVTVVFLGPYGAGDRRFDFVKTNDVWKIVWVGDRSIQLK
jgi:hypothetical protein